MAQRPEDELDGERKDLDVIEHGLHAACAGGGWAPQQQCSEIDLTPLEPVCIVILQFILSIGMDVGVGAQ